MSIFTEMETVISDCDSKKKALEKKQAESAVAWNKIQSEVEALSVDYHESVNKLKDLRAQFDNEINSHLG